MEKKFRVDMDFDDDGLSEKDIFDNARIWVCSEIKERQLKNVYYIEGLQIYPYAVVFILFMNGFHEIALDYLESKSHCSPEFISMYRDYIFQFNCHCIPKAKIMHYFEQVIDEKG